MMMWKDEIVEEVRRNREVYAAKFNYDLNAIYHDLKAKERESKRKLVSFPPKHPIKQTTARVDKTVDV
jgi:transposase